MVSVMRNGVASCSQIFLSDKKNIRGFATPYSIFIFSKKSHKYKKTKKINYNLKSNPMHPFAIQRRIQEVG
jgi:hypothetical protein